MHTFIEEEPKSHVDISPDAIVDVFEVDDTVEEISPLDVENETDIDLPFKANDEGYW